MMLRMISFNMDANDAATVSDDASTPAGKPSTAAAAPQSAKSTETIVLHVSAPSYLERQETRLSEAKETKANAQPLHELTARIVAFFFFLGPEEYSFAAFVAYVLYVPIYATGG